MENSILTSTKKVLGIGEDYEVFDLDIITHINSAFSTLNQLGIGPVVGFWIEDKTAVWDDLDIPQNQMGMVRGYIYLKTRIAFDPPTTSFLIDAINKQILEHEWRLNTMREGIDWVAPVYVLPSEGLVTIDGGSSI